MIESTEQELKVALNKLSGLRHHTSSTQAELKVKPRPRAAFVLTKDIPTSPKLRTFDHR